MKNHAEHHQVNRVWLVLVSLGLLVVAGCRTPPPSPPAPARALKTAEIDITRVTPATMKTFDVDGKTAYIWWLPPQLLRALTVKLQGKSQADAAQKDALEDYLRVADDYVLIAAGGSAAGPDDRYRTVPRRAVQQQLRLIDAAGNIHRPVALDRLPEKLRELMALISLAFGNAYPQFGGQIQLFAFPARNAQGGLLADPLQPGQFQIHLGDFEARWHLPLGALLAPRQCPVCNRVFPGNYDFCPIDRTLLENRAPLNRSK